MRTSTCTLESLRSGLVLLLLCGPAAALAYSDGPPDGYANNPPFYENCQACHSNLVGDGALALLGAPLGGYTPNATYTLAVELRDPGQRRWGFELTVLDDVANAQAGTLVVTDPVNTQLSDNIGTDADFMKQTLDGTYAGILNGPVTWQFDWTAPDSGNVTFYLAGNAANGNANPTGDVIYWIQHPVTPVTAIEPVAAPAALVRLGPGFPNPFAFATTIPFELAAPDRVRLTLHDVSGRLVRSLLDATLPAGRNAVMWDGRDANGRPAPRGVYFLTLATSTTELRERVVLGF